MVGNGDDFIDAFSEALRRKYNQHKPEKGDSWLGMGMPLLYEILDEEYEEVGNVPLDDSSASELTDLGLVAAMLWWRENGQTTPHVPPPR